MRPTDRLVRITERARHAAIRKAEYEFALNERDNEIRAAINSGVTMYRIAKKTGLTETAIRKIRDR